MKPLTLAVAMALSGTSPAFGQVTTPAAVAASEPARMDAARELILLIDIDRTLNFMFDNIAPMFAQSVIGMMHDQPEVKPLLDELISKGDGGQPRLAAILSEEFLVAIKAQYPALKTQVIAEYAAAFTTEELRALTAFYRTGAGEKSLKVLPDLQGKMAKAGQELGRTAGENAGRKGFERAIEEMLPRSGRPKT